MKPVNSLPKPALVHAAANLVVVDRCRICQAQDGIETVTATRQRFTTTWIRCSGCGVERASRYPSAEELAAYYNDHYLEQDCRSDVSHRLRWSPAYRETVWNEYVTSTADLGLQPDALRDMDILDFGCADGIFLDWLVSVRVPRERLHGVDVSPQMIDIARSKGHQVTTTENGAAGFGKQFDLVTLWDVIEHVPSPVETVQEVGRLLRPEGEVLIQTPRIGVLSEQLGDQFNHYVPLEHLHLFTREALVNLFEAQGFATVAAASFGANAPATRVPAPFKQAYDRLAKTTDNGATQLARFRRV